MTNVFPETPGHLPAASQLPWPLDNPALALGEQLFPKDPQQQLGQVNLLPASNMKTFNFEGKSEARCVVGVVVRGRCGQAWLAGSTALPLSVEFQQNLIHLCACIHPCILTFLQGLGPMEKRKMWLGGNSNILNRKHYIKQENILNRKSRAWL